MFSRRREWVGLDIGSSGVKLVQLAKSGKEYRLEKLGMQELDAGVIVDGVIMNAQAVVLAIQTLFSEQSVKAKDVALSVSGHSVIVKRIKLPVMTRDELAESIKWEAEQYIPFDVKDVSIDCHILGRSEGEANQMDVVLVAVKKDKLQEYTGLVVEAGLRPVVVDVDAFALGNMYEMNYEIREGEVVALVNIGASVMNIHILKGGNFVFTRDISIGGNRYNETIQGELAVDYPTAERAKRGEPVEGIDQESLSGIIQSINMEIASEIVRSFDYFKMTSVCKTIDQILLSGGLSKLSGLVSQIAEKSGTPVEKVNPFRRVEVPQKLFNLEYRAHMGPMVAVGVGLAMRAGEAS